MESIKPYLNFLYCVSLKIFKNIITVAFLSVISVFTEAQAFHAQEHKIIPAEYHHITLPPKNCKEQIKIHIATFNKNKKNGNITTQQHFRLEVLQGNLKRVMKTLATLPPADAKASRQWGDAANRIETIQVALDDAALTNQSKMIKLLIEHGASPNLSTNWPTVPAIMVAAQCGNVTAMKTLYKFGADLSLPEFNDNPSNHPRNAIEVAISERQNASALWLLQHGVNVCSKAEHKRITSSMKYPTANGKIDNKVLKYLKCTNN